MNITQLLLLVRVRETHRCAIQQRRFDDARRMHAMFTRIRARYALACEGGRMPRTYYEE